MNNWLRIGHEWLLPRHCLLCLGAAIDTNLCTGCRRALPLLENPCQGCGAPLITGRRCARCLKRPPPFQRVSIPYLYVDPLRTLIHALKFRHRLAVASVLGTLLADHLETCGIGLPQCVVPVPLHRKRQRHRGFNQSLEIARPISTRFKLPIAPTLTRRIRSTAAQSSLQSADSRRHNVRGAFCVETKAIRSLQHVAIVDDVVTTGATVTALALALKTAGVSRVEIWSVARARE